MIGKILDSRYEVISKLGQGAFGTTYLAIDRKLPDKDQCVVKHFSPRATDPATLELARRLFETEAKVLNRLGSHDRIPRLLAHFEQEQQFYLVEEFIAGHDLSFEFIPDKQISEQEVIVLLQDILEVLEFVHKNNVIHRDIKPSNLIRRQQDGKIVLVDFGAVKQISSQTGNLQGAANLTVAIGTPGYMPSEQTQGQPRLCSDIYAVGIIGICALTGLRATQLPQDTLTGEIIWRNQAQVSQKLAEIIEKMVKYDFRQRYQSATEVLQALQSLKPSEPILWKALIGVGIVTASAIALVPILIPSEKLESYSNMTYGISIKYPQTWMLSEIPDSRTGSLAKFISPKESNSDQYQENVILFVNLPANNKKLDEYTRNSITEIKQFFPDAKIISEGKTELAKLPAYQIVYTGKEEGNDVQVLQVWTIKDNRIYLINYTAQVSKYSKYLKSAQTMIHSLEIQ
ncbi:serine/threonine protein kinase [Westiellopsis prolifica IICB1]|nr:serine/threonine protein kinase [Westiellopsis prolifica IICB1]